MSSPGEDKHDLDRLRQELATVDLEIVERVKRRQQLASQIGEVKRASGIGTRNYRQERDVIERARAAATSFGLDEDTAEELMVLLIRSSLTVQEQESVVAAGGGDGKHALIIGGHGQMGRWFARFLSSQGYRVTTCDPAGPVDGFDHIDDWAASELDHDLIVVAAPLPASNDILLEMANAPPAATVFDIGSLKSPLRSGLRALADAGGRVTSVHPMFGPDTELLSGRHIIYVDVGHAEATARAKELFASTMAVQVDMDLESHDRLIAYVLGLSHALNIAFFTALAESGEASGKLAELSSTTFDAQLGVAAKVAGENPKLYFEIQKLNDYGSESLSALLYAVERLRNVVRSGDVAEFERLMERGRAYLRGRAEHSSSGRETPS